MFVNREMEVFKKRLRFGNHDDLALLREVLAQNPLENPRLWEVIQENLSSITGKDFSIRTLKEHLEHLIKIWLEETKLLKGKSVIEEQPTEKDILCQNIYDLMQEFKKEKRIKKTVFGQKKEGENARNKWVSMLDNPQPFKPVEILEKESVDHDHSYIDHTSKTDQNEVILNIDSDLNGTMVESEEVISNCKENNPPPKFEPATSSRVLATPKSTNVFGPIRSRKRKINAQRQGLAYLEEYDKQQMAIKKKEIEIEERRLALEERKIALEEKKINMAEFEIQKKYELDEKKINFEIEERKELKKIIERQDKILNLVLSKGSF